MVVGRGPWGDATATMLTEHAIATPDRVDVREAVARVGVEPRPAVAVVTDADPDDRVLVACLASGVPVVDVHRSIAAVDRARTAMRAGTLVAASGWGGGAAAVVVAAACQEVGGPPADHVEVAAQLAPGDRAGDAWWRRFAGLHRSFMVYEGGQRRLVRGLGEPRAVDFAHGRRRARRVASPEQETLVETGASRSAAVRVAFAEGRTNVWLALLVGSGAWRFLPAAWRARILRPRTGQRSGGHEVDVVVAHAQGVVLARIVAAHGLAHLVAAGACVQVGRLLRTPADDDAATPPVDVLTSQRVSHPEESDDPCADLATLRALGIQVDLEVRRSP